MTRTAPGSTAEQTPTRPPRTEEAGRGLFPQLFPRPTGRNGYEELVLAGDTLATSRAFRELRAQQRRGEDVLLASKRRALVDPPVARADALLTRGLAKPVRSPRDNVEGEARFPGFVHFRELAAMLELQQYVQLAASRVPEGLRTAERCLQLGRAVQVDRAHSAQAGLRTGAACLLSLGAHLNQLPVRECERLLALCWEWLAQPEPTVAVLEAEQARLKAELGRMKEAVERVGISARLLPKGNEEPGPPGDPRQDTARRTQFLEGIQRLRQETPQGFETLWLETTRVIDRWFATRIAAAKQPAWQREHPKPEETPAFQLATTLFPLERLAREEYTPLLARVRLLAAHAAVLRYRWENDKLPPGLEALDLGETASDPYSGQLILFAPAGRRYRLTSAGPLAEPGDPKAVRGRLAISVVPGE